MLAFSDLRSPRLHIQSWCALPFSLESPDPSATALIRSMHERIVCNLVGSPLPIADSDPTFFFRPSPRTAFQSSSGLGSRLSGVPVPGSPSSRTLAAHTRSQNNEELSSWSNFCS